MCKYCTDNKRISEKDKYGEGAESYIADDALIVVHFATECGYSYGSAEIEINYCPMCGRKF